MTPPVSLDSLPAHAEGFVIQGPARVTIRKKTVGRPVWDRSESEASDYFGDMNVDGVIQIDTPPGTQYATWFRFDKRLRFVVRDLRDGSVQTTSYVDGGWNLAREGVSVNMAPDPADAVSEAEFNQMAPTGMPHRWRFRYQLDDHLPTLYAASTTLEVHGEYLGLRSNTILIELEVVQE